MVQKLWAGHERSSIWVFFDLICFGGEYVSRILDHFQAPCTQNNRLYSSPQTDSSSMNIGTNCPKRKGVLWLSAAFAVRFSECTAIIRHFSDGEVTVLKSYWGPPTQGSKSHALNQEWHVV